MIGLIQLDVDIRVSEMQYQSLIVRHKMTLGTYRQDWIKDSEKGLDGNWCDLDLRLDGGNAYLSAIPF